MRPKHEIFDEINDTTGFATGDKFTSEQQVLDYFTVDAQREMFGDDCVDDPDLLLAYATTVIDNHWHME